MRINHNIAAMNTYRQLTGNTAATSKSLEKLSSGLRINRAGDDAAGLAISEKMRAQIRGLDQASRNSQDGISLIQTAEGALQETHSILQRMRELATQAANGTNTDSDRAEIQKEINQLTSEINRISETTQFNKITLLKGELNLQSAVTAKAAGSTVAGAVEILSAATKATATGEELASANISAIGGPTVAGTRAFADPSTANSGPKVEKTSAVITGDAASANISALGGTTLTGDIVFDPTTANSGPKVEKTSAAITGNAASANISALGGTTLTGDIVFDPTTANSGPALARTAAETAGASLATATAVIDSYTGPSVTFSRDFSAGTATIVGDVEAGNNEIQITLNGGSVTLALDPTGYTAGTGTVNDLLTELNAKISASSLTDKTHISFVLNEENKIELRTNTAADTLAVNGGGLVTSWMLTTPADTFATQTKTASNGLALTVNGNTQSITLANGSYDFSVAGDQTAFLADIQAKLNTAFGTGAVTASFVSDKLTFTNTLTGAGSKIENISGSAAALLGLDSATYTQGTENNELLVSYNGVQKNLNLALDNYAAGDDNGAAEWLDDINAKLETAYGTGNVVASFNADGKIVFTTANNGDTLSIDGGGAKALIGASFAQGSAGAGNNALTLSVNGVSKSITLADGVYDFSNAANRSALLSDLNTKLDAAFGAGNVVATFDTDNKLVLTNTLTGTGSTLTGFSGLAAGALGLDTATPVQGTDNTDLTVNYNGTIKTINLAANDYSAGGTDGATEWLDDINAKLDAAYGAGEVVASFNSDGKIVFTTANNGDTFSIVSGGAKALIGNSFTAGSSGVGNNALTLSVNGVSKSITLADGVYDFSNAANRSALLSDLNTKLDAAFGAGNVVATFDTDNKLVLTNTLTGTGSTLTGFSGLAAGALGLDDATPVQGTDNTGLTVTYNGTTKTVSLAENDYSAGGTDGADDFLSDIQAKLDAAFGANSITATFDADNKVVFTAANVTDTLTIDGGAAAALLKADPSDAFETGISGTGNNALTLTVNGTTKSVTLSDGTYDFSVAANRSNFLNDLNSKLNTAFGAGNVVASFNTDNKLVLTDSLTGNGSTLTNITGSATAALGLTAATYEAGKNANNTGTITVDGHAVDISLTAGTYSGGSLATELQAQIRNADAALANTTVDFIKGSFVITSGAAGSGGSVAVSAGDLTSALKLTTQAGGTFTAGTDAVDNGLKLQVGANAEQSMGVDISDMSSQALKVSGATTGTVTASDGKTASYVATANVTDGTNNESIEYALDISSNEKATAAISVLDDAIQAASAERSKLGAFQNRLEHTINNLGTSSENLTAAESRIRDVDMAKEMMEFTKNNILSQAAQAMLAQANQQPQGVLQLLR